MRYGREEVKADGGNGPVFLIFNFYFLPDSSQKLAEAWKAG